MVVVVAVLAFVAGDGTTISIEGELSVAEWIALVGLALMLPLAGVAGWLTAREAAHRRTVSTIAVIAMAAALVAGGSMSDKLEGVLGVAVLVAAVLVLNGLGVGSVLSWAVRLTFSHLASVGTLVARALPVVLLTVLVFFNGYVWSMAAKISRERLWLVIGFLVLISVAFLFTGIVERIGPILARREGPDTATATPLADTPFAALPDPDSPDPLSRDERRNVMFVVVASQLVQIAMVALVTSAIFLVLGLIVLSPELLATWSPHTDGHGILFGATVPVPQSLIHVTMFLGALTFMYVSARAVGDGEYRAEFLDPLVEDLRLTLLARGRYREALRDR